MILACLTMEYLESMEFVCMAQYGSALYRGRILIASGLTALELGGNQGLFLRASAICFCSPLRPVGDLCIDLQLLT